MRKVHNGTIPIKGSSTGWHNHPDSAIIDAKRKAQQDLRGIRRRSPRGIRIVWTREATEEMKVGREKLWKASVEGYGVPK